jgi:AraC-like DNA-binding protein
MKHVEFFDIDHFENKYHRTWTKPPLSLFVDFFWETDFDALFQQYPEGFSDVLFPNTGYTYLINLGTPFIMQVGNDAFPMRSDGFLPRHKCIECFHSKGNRLFGIKFRVSPVIFQKKINFLEYRNQIYPLSYLIEQHVINNVKAANSFNDRVVILSDFFLNLIEQFRGTFKPIEIVIQILENVFNNNEFETPISEWSKRYHISERTLQRYFESATGVSTKQAIQIMRIRKAVSTIANRSNLFRYKDYGYYDYSHFYKHLKSFLHKETLLHLKPHLTILKEMRGS